MGFVLLQKFLHLHMGLPQTFEEACATDFLHSIQDQILQTDNVQTGENDMHLEKSMQH